jgi:hypothetical protein
VCGKDNIFIKTYITNLGITDDVILSCAVNASKKCTLSSDNLTNSTALMEEISNFRNNFLIELYSPYYKILYDIKSIIPEHIHSLFTKETKYYINPAGEWNIGGPVSDCGLTGRKIIADTYGGWGGHGGGAFSGKDASKVDRSAAYAARWIAKNLVANGFCKRVMVQIAYSIGISKPLSIFVESYGTVVEGFTDQDLIGIVSRNFDLRPGALIKDLQLKRPIF